MKPRSRRFVTNALPALIIVPISLSIAHAVVISTNPLSDFILASSHSGNDSIRANSGGTSPFSVTIQAGAELFGDEDFLDGIRVVTGNYTIHNFGTIDTSRDGIRFTVDGGAVNNYGSVTGLERGVKGENGFYLKNFFATDPVESEPDSEPVLIDGTQAEITATDDHAVKAGDEAEIINEGIIRSDFGDGINVGDNAEIENSEVYDENFEESIVSGEISGGDDGISAGAGLTLTNEINAKITGNGGDGVNAKDNALISNWGEIFGQDDGIDLDQIQEVITEGMTFVSTFEEEAELAQSTIYNYGSIIGELGDGINGSSMIETIYNYGTIEGEDYAIDLGGGADSLTLYAGSTITGDIHGGGGVDTLTFINGATTPFDDDSNVVFGSVFSMETITKNGYGTAIIGELPSNPQEYTGDAQINDFLPIPNLGIVEADYINVNGGALYINAHVTSATEWRTIVGVLPFEDPKTSIYVNGGEIGGTNGLFLRDWSMDSDFQTVSMDGIRGWEANISIRNGGGISAGSQPQSLSPLLIDGPPALSMVEPEPMSSHPSIGRLVINGNVTHETFEVDKRVLQDVETDLDLDPYVPIPTYIRVDINPDAEISEGYNSDLIVQTGKNSIYDMTGAEVWIAPTDGTKALTNGFYTIIDSERNIVGFDPETTKIGVVIQNEPAPVFEGGLLRTEIEAPTSYVSYDTVLGNFFATLHLAEPEETDYETTISAFSGIQLLGLSPTELGTNLVLGIDYNFSDLPGLTENQSSFGEALDQFIGEPENFEDPGLTDLIEDLANQDLPTAQAALATLDPSSSFSVVQSAVNSNYRLHRLTQNHLAAVRGGSQTSSEVGASSKDAKGAMTAGTVTTTTTGRGNLWGTMSYDDQDFDGDLSEADFDGDTGSFTAGIDWLVAPQLILGLVFDGSKADLDGDGSNSTDIDSFRAAAYGTWGGAMGFYSDFLVGYGSHDFDNTKSFDLLGDLSSSTDASSLQAMWTAGYTMGDENIAHGPFAGFEYQKVDVDGYTQGGIVPIEVEDYDVDSFRGLIGYRVDANFGKFSPYAAVAYAHEFEDGSNTANASLGGSPFTVEGGEQSSAILISIGTGYALTNALTVDFGYRGEIATDDGITSHGASLGLNYSF